VTAITPAMGSLGRSATFFPAIWPVWRS
jgi:hypothetical protein